MKKVDNRCWKITRLYSNIHLRQNKDGEHYYDGYCVTPFGIVSIYHQIEWLTMRFVLNGYEYYREVRGKNYTRAGIAIMVGKFIREIDGKSKHI